MELWVRSQNKEKLVKIDHIEYYKGYDPIDEYDGFTTHEILANEEEIELGQYKNAERCLEIIGEIQKLLMSNLDDYVIFKDCEATQEQLKNFMETKKAIITSGQNSPPASVEIMPCNLRVYEMPQE